MAFLGVAIQGSGLLFQVNSLRLPSGHAGPVLILSNAARASLASPCWLVVDAGVCSASPLGVTIGHVVCGFRLFIFPPSYVALWGSKARHRLPSENVSWCLETSLFFKTPFPRQIFIPTSFVSLFIFYIFSYLLSKTMGCFPGCLTSSACIQKCVLWHLLSFQTFFWWICWGRKWSSCPILQPS